MNFTLLSLHQLGKTLNSVERYLSQKNRNGTYVRHRNTKPIGFLRSSCCTLSTQSCIALRNLIILSPVVGELPRMRLPFKSILNHVSSIIAFVIDVLIYIQALALAQC